VFVAFGSLFYFVCVRRVSCLCVCFWFRVVFLEVGVLDT